MKVTRAGAALAQLLIGGLWLGACAMFAIVVAPAAFAVLPSRTLAGQFIGRLLPMVFLSGIAVCAAVVLLGVRTDAASRWKPRVLSAAIGGGACTLAQFVVGRSIDELRDQIHGPVEALAVTDPLRVAFGQLHALSVVLLGIAIVCLLVVVVIAGRDLSRSS
jgi:hypothetical protein